MFFGVAYESSPKILLLAGCPCSSGRHPRKPESLQICKVSNNIRVVWIRKNSCRYSWILVKNRRDVGVPRRRPLLPRGSARCSHPQPTAMKSSSMRAAAPAANLQQKVPLRFNASSSAIGSPALSSSFRSGNTPAPSPRGSAANPRRALGVAANAVSDVEPGARL